MTKKNVTLTFILVLALIFYLFNSENTSSTKILKSVENPHIESSKIPAISKMNKISNEKVELSLSNPIYSLVATEYEKAEDLYAFALAQLEFASRGDEIAQYWLSKALVECEGAIHFRKGASSSFFESYQLRYVERLIARCALFTTENLKPFGRYENWIKKSAKSGYWPSKVAEMIVKEKRDNKVLLESINSKNAEAIELAGDFISDPIESASWKLLSCYLGKSCKDHSTEDWGLTVLIDCNSNESWGELCEQGMSLNEYYKIKYPSEHVQISNKAKNYFQRIKEGNLSEELFNKIFQN